MTVKALLALRVGNVTQRLVARLLVIMLSAFTLVALTAAPSSAQDELVLTASVYQVSWNPRTRVVGITGTVTCSEPAIVSIAGTVTQASGSDESFTRLECTGPEGTTFMLSFLALEGRFRPGPAHLHLYLEGCVLVSSVCEKQATLETDTNIRLQPAP
jgi:hypothetical protein